MALLSSLRAPGVPGFRLENTCTQGRYRLEKEVLADPLRETVLQRTRFVSLKGSLEEYHLYALLAPHIGNRGEGNTGWVGEYKGVPMLFAERQGICLAVANSAPWIKRSGGFVGFSDAWQNISLHRRMTCYRRAENGNIALAGEVDLGASNGEFVIAVGFGRNDAEAGNRALASVADGFERAKRRYVSEWQKWQAGLLKLEGSGSMDLYRASTAVMRVHEAKNFPGGLIASLSIPWDFAKGDDDLGGYHLVWPRDLAEAAGGLLAAGANEYADTVLGYLQSTQEPDGHWPQNMWLDGTPYWSGIQNSDG